jgi:hypothetical protein
LQYNCSEIEVIDNPQSPTLQTITLVDYTWLITRCLNRRRLNYTLIDHTLFELPLFELPLVAISSNCRFQIFAIINFKSKITEVVNSAVVVVVLFLGYSTISPRFIFRQID